MTGGGGAGLGKDLDLGADLGADLGLGAGLDLGAGLGGGSGARRLGPASFSSEMVGSAFPSLRARGRQGCRTSCEGILGSHPIHG